MTALNLLLGAALLVQGPASGSAASPAADTLRLSAAVQDALDANPMLRAARLRADAAQERVPQAGALPDPDLSLGLMNRMTSDLGSTMDPMTMNQVQFMQMLPWPGKLGFARDRAGRLAEAERLEADDAELMLIARVKSVYYEIAYMDRALVIMGSSRGLLRDFVQVSQAMYAVGTGVQQDVLQAQVGVARMTEDITVMAQERVAMAARLNALLGREATVPVGALELPGLIVCCRAWTLWSRSRWPGGPSCARPGSAPRPQPSPTARRAASCSRTSRSAWRTVSGRSSTTWPR